MFLLEGLHFRLRYFLVFHNLWPMSVAYTHLHSPTRQAELIRVTRYCFLEDAQPVVAGEATGRVGAIIFIGSDAVDLGA